MANLQQSTANRKRAMLDALRANLGIVTPSAEQAKIDRTTHYLWMDNDPEYKAEVERI